MTLFAETDIIEKTKVRGKLIDKLKATNVKNMGGDRCAYRIEYEEYNGNGERINLIEFNVTHNPNDGAAELKRIAYSEISRRKAR
ncbi:MAG: hypothetical protein AABX93_03085 [Nanoarchaeota archaeon]